MSFARLPVLVAIVVSAGLWALGIVLVPSGGHGAYSVLVCGGDVPDKTIRERLEKEGFSALVSESSQWVLLDSFTRIEQIPLDEYDSRVLSFDPRNDGYAEKLRSLFVQDGRRFVYIPQTPVPAQAAGVEKKLASALGDIPYTYFDAQSLSAAAPRQVGFPLIVFCVAGLVFLIIPPLRRVLQPHAACFVPLLPILAPLCLGGVAGFALASLLAGFAVILVEPCFKRLTRLQGVYRRQRQLSLQFQPQSVPKLKQKTKPPLPPPQMLSLPLLLAAYGILAFFSGLPLVFTLVTLACFCGIFAFALWGVSRLGDDASLSAVFGSLFVRRQDSERRRFSPVLILKPRVPVFAFSRAMIPFAAAALVVVFTGVSASSGIGASPVLPSPSAVTEADYQSHYLFQSAFSEKSLYALESPNGMNVYELSPDGLSVIPAAMPPKQKTLPPAPPFPLADLLKFLDNPGSGGSMLYEILFALLPLLFVFSPLVWRKR